MSASPPPTATTPPNNPTPTPLRRLLDETSDLIDSPPFTHVLTKLLDAAFSTLIDVKTATQAFKLPLPPTTTTTTTTDPAPRITELPSGSNDSDATTATAKTKVATVLAVMTRQAHSIGNGVPNGYLQAMESVRDLEGFAALVYSSNFEFEALGSGVGSSSAAATMVDASRSDSGKADEVPGLGGGAGSVVTGEGASILEIREADHPISRQEEEGVGLGGGEGQGQGEARLVKEAESGFEDAWGKVVAAGSGWGGGDGQGPMTG